MDTPLGPTADTELVRCAAEGTDEAFALLHHRHHDAVMQTATRILRNRDIAQEVSQEVFLDLWRRPERFDPTRGTLAAFLVIQTRGRAIDRIRNEDARRRREERSGTDPATAPLPMVDGGIDRHELVDALASLADAQRTPIELAFLHGYTYREVATHLATAEGTVKSRIRSGLRTMRDSLADAPVGILSAA